MTLASTAARPHPTRVPESRPALHAVPRPRPRRPRLAYGIVAVAGAVAIVTAQMMLSVMTTQTSYRIADLTTQQRQATLQRQVLHEDVAGLGSPQYLAANAEAMGMVINQSPSYLRLSDGAIIGTPKAADHQSSVAPGGHTIANALIADTPLVTNPHETVGGPTATPKPKSGPVTPPPVTGGLPSVRTH